MSQVNETRPIDCSKLTSQDALTSASFLNIELDGDEPFCRICHYPGGRLGDPLLRPCRCTGTLGDVHRSCLESWLNLTRIKSCTICNFSFNTRTTMKPFAMWRCSPMTCPDVTLLTFVIIAYITLLVEVIALCVISIQYLQDKSYPLACGIAGLAIGIPWQIAACVGLTVDLYFSNYWTNWREQNKRVMIVFSTRTQQENMNIA